HKLNEQAMVTGLKAMGLTIFGNPDTKLPPNTCVEVPEGVDEAAFRSILLSNLGVKIAAAFGPLAGKVWRIGNMCYSSRKEIVLLALAALEASLLFNDVQINKGEGVLAAMKV
ncbi:MAG: alanine--glyoxylate aminotransferase family protein, partial [Carnobacterium sp.]